ncbi:MULTISPECIES: oxygenase MpaB family protein [unclassified Microbacterium]|uniref:oxygenase MpaB family protein n=1 Tax=unclassified Microbacterium TaxID=2609290 RepID=UPI00301A8A88
MRTRRSTSSLRSRLLVPLAGDPDGTPPWVLRLEHGDDRGLFDEDGPAWTVHSGIPTLVAGIQALLLQALHPGAMAGVHDWSRYRDDPLGRLSGTVRWVISTTFGSREQVDGERARVARFHTGVRGEYEAHSGRRAYSAEDADLVEWVHLAFTDAFLTAHERWGGTIPGGRDAYVADWATAGTLMGVVDPPRTAADLRARMHGLLADGTLRGGARVDEVVRFLRDVPLDGSLRIGYRILFAGAIAAIPREYRRLLGVRRSWFPAVTATRLVLWIAQRSLGTGPRAHDIARIRLRRLDAAVPQDESPQEES